MSVNSGVVYNRYLGNNTTDTFDYTFKIFDASHLVVVKRDDAGVETELVLNTDYTVSGVGQDAGGDITLIAGNLPDDHVLSIRLDQALVQTVRYRNQRAWLPEIQEDSLDKLTKMAQVNDHLIEKSLKLPETVLTTEFDPTLPTDIVGAEKRVLITDPAGSKFEMGPTAQEIINAEAFANMADDFQILSQEWAIKMDGPVSGGEFSSKYHATESAVSAGLSEGYKDEAEIARDAAVVAQLAAEAVANVNGNIGNLLDVDTTSTPPVDKDILRWNASMSRWEPYTYELNDLSNVNTGNTIPDGAVLVYNLGDAEWVASPLPAFPVTEVNGQVGAVNLDSDDIPEGSVNEYYTDAKVDAVFAGKGIDDLSDVDTSSTPPLDGQSLVWNDSLSKWEPQNATIVGRIGELADVDTDTVNPTNGQVLVYSGDPYPDGKFIPADIATSISGLSDVDLTTPQEDGQVLAWDEADSAWKPADQSGGGGGATNYSLNPNFRRTDDGVSSSSVNLTFELDDTRAIVASKSPQSLKVLKAASDIDGEFIALDSLINDEQVVLGGRVKVGLVVDSLTDTNYVHNFYKIVVVDPATSNVLNVGDTFIERGSIRKYEVLVDLPSGVDNPETRLVAVGTNATAFTVWIGEHYVEELGQVVINGIGDWVQYTPSYVGFGTVTGDKVQTKIVDDMMFLEARIPLGTTTANIAEMSLPSGITFSSSYTQPTIVGTAQTTASSNVTHFSLIANGGGLLDRIYFGFRSATSPANSIQTPTNGNTLFGSGVTLHLKARFKIDQPVAKNSLTNFELALKSETVLASKNSGSHTSSGNYQDVAWTVTQDKFGSFDGTTFTAQQDGDYEFTAHVEFDESNSTGTRVIKLIKGASTDLFRAPAVLASTTNRTGLSTKIRLLKDEQVKIGAFQNSGGTLAYSTNGLSRLSISRKQDTTVLNAIQENEDRELHLDGGNGFGSTNLRVRRYSNVRKNTLGSWATYSDSATLGGRITFHKPCKIFVQANDYRTTVSTEIHGIGIFVNGSGGADNYISGGRDTYAQGLRASEWATKENTGLAPSTVINVRAGDVIWVQAQLDVNGGANNRTNLRINIISSSY